MKCPEQYLTYDIYKGYPRAYVSVAIKSCRMKRIPANLISCYLNLFELGLKIS